MASSATKPSTSPVLSSSPIAFTFNGNGLAFGIAAAPAETPSGVTKPISKLLSKSIPLSVAPVITIDMLLVVIVNGQCTSTAKPPPVTCTSAVGVCSSLVRISRIPLKSATSSGRNVIVNSVENPASTMLLPGRE